MDREDSMEAFSLSFFKNLFLSLVNEKRKLNNSLQTILLSSKYDMTSIYLYGSLVEIYSTVMFIQWEYRSPLQHLEHVYSFFQIYF